MKDVSSIAGADGIQPLDVLFFDLFKGVLALFLQEMGLVSASRIADLRIYGAFFVGFAIAMLLIAGMPGWSLGAEGYTIIDARSRGTPAWYL